MLLFGGNLTNSGNGRKYQNATSASPTAAKIAKQHVMGHHPNNPQYHHSSTGHDGSTEEVTLTPHTDVLQRLTNHELRLLEELERTRAKLQEEWRTKVADLERETGQEIPMPSLEDLTQLIHDPHTIHRLSPPKNREEEQEEDGDQIVRKAMYNKTMSLSESQKTKSFLPHKKKRTSSPSSRGVGGRISSSSSLQHLSLSDSEQYVKRHLSHASTGVFDNEGQQSLPVLRNRLDMLPILTNTGETPFEVGLGNDSTSMDTSPTKSIGSHHHPQHVLPIFRLPTVTSAAAVAAVSAGAKKVEVKKEEHPVIDDASKALGLSMEEIEMFEAQLKGSPTKTTTSNKQAPPIDLIDPSGMPRAFLPDISPQKSKKKQKRKGHHASESSPYAHVPVATGTSHILRRIKSNMESLEHATSPTKQMMPSSQDALRKELEIALENVQHFTSLVREDIHIAHKICPISDPRTKLFMKRWGREKVEGIVRRFLYNIQGIAFQRWASTVAQEKQREKMQTYLMYKGSKKLDDFLLGWSRRKLRHAWSKWWGDILVIKAQEMTRLQLESVQVIQRAWRGYCARRIVRYIRAQKLEAKRRTAAVMIQRHYRGNLARNLFNLKLLAKRQQEAAIEIQALTRGFIARRRYRSMKRDKTQYLAAGRIQASYRGRKTRKQTTILREQKKLNEVALKIQRRYRGRLGRAKYIRRQIERQQKRAAIAIQKIIRGKLARLLLTKRRQEEKIRRQVHTKAAIKIQAVYRGHRARLATSIKLMALREKNKRLAVAATVIQTLIRRFLAVCRVKKMRRDKMQTFVNNARRWVEFWSEDASQWFYYNTETGEALWNPPSTGYTKADKTLVLENGKMVEDPGELIQDLAAATSSKLDKKEDTEGTEEDSAASEHDEDEEKLCVECEVEEARRHCAQCEDVFCEECYEKLHASSKRSQHTWKAIGSVRCIECEKMKATRWCSQCQDPYCLGCFTIIHAKGNKSSHAWTEMKKGKRVGDEADQENSQTYEEFLRSAEYQYVSEFSQEEGYSMSATAPAVNKGGEEWVYTTDPSSGQGYYYNTFTGETRWA